MSSGNYLETARRLSPRRELLVTAAVAKMRKLVKSYVEFDDGGVGNPARTRAASLDRKAPDDLTWFDLFNGDGLQLEKADTIGTTAERAVGSAVLKCADGEKSWTVCTIQVEPPNLFGFDGSPLTVDQIENIAEVMFRYEGALTAPRANA